MIGTNDTGRQILLAPEWNEDTWEEEQRGRSSTHVLPLSLRVV